MTPTATQQKERDATLQQITDRDPTLGNSLMDTLGYTKGNPPVNSINAGQIPTTPAVYSTYSPTPTAHVGLAETAVAQKDAYLANVAKETEALQTDQAAGKVQIQGVVDRVKGLFGEKSKQYQDQGINDQRKEIDSLVSDMESTERSYDKQIEALDKNPNRQFGGAVVEEKNKLIKEKASVLADQAIVLNARNRTYETAKSVIDEKVNAETEMEKFNLTNLQYFYDKNESNLTADQKTLLNEKIKAADDELTTARDLRKQIGDLQLEAAKKNAPVSVIRSIGSSATVDDAIANSGGYLSTVKDSASGAVKFTPEDQRALIGAGFMASELAQIQSDVNQYGLSTVLEGIADPKQKAALQKAFGQVADDESKLTRGSLAALYGIDDNEVALPRAKWLGIIPHGETQTGKDYIDALEKIVTTYRDVGYTDKEIMKLIKDQQEE